MLHPDYPLWSILGIVLVLLPAPWHWRARNVATISLIAWLCLANTCLSINTLIWADNYIDHSPIWCDISGRILMSVSYAVPACSFSQMRRLESVASTRRSLISARERSRRTWEEVCLCVVFPLAMLPVNYLLQGHRYDILESIGCSIPTYRSWPGILVRYFVPAILSIAALLFASLSVRWFVIRRWQFRSILASSEAGLTVDRYLRLIALAVTDVVILLVNDILAITTALGGMGDFLKAAILTDSSFGTVHYNFGQISQIPEGITTPITNSAQALGFYVAPIYSIAFFIFFGFGEEAISEYLGLVRKTLTVLSRLGRPSLNSKISQPGCTLNLGSKVVVAGIEGASWAGQTSEVITGAEDINEKLVDYKSSSTRQQSRTAAIPVHVERSVV